MTNPNRQINRWLKFLRWFCPPHLYEGIEGDLMEEFEEDVRNLGEPRALRRFKGNVLRFFRPGILLRNKYSNDLIGTIMWKNYFITGYRSILRRKLYSFINAFGLSIAIAFCSLIYLYIHDERSFDQFEVNKDRIYQMIVTSFDDNKFKKGDKEPYHSNAYLPAALGDRMREELPEVEHMTHFSYGGEGTMIYGDKVFLQEYASADSGFFKMFTFQVLEGSPNHLFENPSDAVLTEETARKYFGDQDPIGKTFTLNIDTLLTMKVVAVVKTPPANSSINFKMLIPMETSPWYRRNRDKWGNFSYPTFVELRAGTDIATFGAHLDSLQNKYMGERFKAWSKMYDVPKEYKVDNFGFVPLTQVHLNTGVDWQKTSDPKYAWILGGIAVLILVIACINYISLALTTSTARRTEVGVRKVAGAPRRQLMIQFGLESVLLAVVSMILAAILVVAFLPSFNSFTNKDIELTLPLMGLGILAMLGISVTVGLVAGSYPAVFLSGFLPAHVLKGGFKSRLKAGFSRPLVIIQFFLSACMIISSIVMYRQMQFITTKDLGYDKDQLIAVGTQAGWNKDSDLAVQRLRNQLADETSVVGMTGTDLSFNQGWSIYGYKVNGENKSAFMYDVDPNYIPLLGITLKEGRNFDPDRASDSTALIVNEALVKDMGWKDGLSKHLNWGEDSTSVGPLIIGVVKNYNFLSLETSVKPMILQLAGTKNHYLTTMLIKLKKGRLKEGLEKIQKAWSGLFPNRPFDYTFVDDDVAKQYDQYQRWMKITGVSTVLAIVIACLGLFGLAGINAVNRTKEVGIRKVLGAELSSIFLLMNREYVVLALIAFGLAVPVSWYGMTHWWLTDFEYHITPGWEIFAGSVTGGLLISLLTVSYHGIRAALINPAETLKYE